VARK
jgi:hypothetical protein